MITAILMKDESTKMTLAKFKAKVNYREVKEDLIYLHENEFIEWSGYKSAKKSLEDKVIDPRVIEVINFMNNLYGRNFKADSPSTTSGLKTQLKSHSVEDIKGVIANRYDRWKDVKEMKDNLKPTTLFRNSNFDKYLEDYKTTRVGEGIISVDKINLKHGDVLTLKAVSNFVDKEAYTFRAYLTDNFGINKGNGSEVTSYGKDIKRMLKIQDNEIKANGRPSKTYIYIVK